MSARGGIGIGRLVILAMFVAALALGGGMRPAQGPSDPQLAAFLAAGGSLSDICHDSGMEKMAAGHCQFCNTVPATVLPAPGRFCRTAESLIIAEVVHPAEIRAASRARDPAVSPRGPPILT